MILDIESNAFVKYARLVLGLSRSAFVDIYGGFSYRTVDLRALVHDLNTYAAEVENCVGAEAEKIGLRIEAAIRYNKLNMRGCAKRIGVSREAVRQWCAGIAIPRRIFIDRLSLLFGIPSEFFILGGIEFLPARTPVGVRFGKENEDNRKRLFELTRRFVIEHKKSYAYTNTAIMATLLADKTAATLARRAGGFYTIDQDFELYFEPFPFFRAEA